MVHTLSGEKNTTRAQKKEILNQEDFVALGPHCVLFCSETYKLRNNIGVNCCLLFAKHHF